MRMHHPLESIALHHRPRVFLALLAGTFTVMAGLNWAGEPLITPAAPYGIVSFELASTADQAREVLSSWDAPARQRAAFSLGLDYLFMPLYAITIGLACLMSASTLRPRGQRWHTAGVWLAWGLLIAAGLDAVENLALAVLLFGMPVDPWPLVAWVCAIIKFVLILSGVLYSFLGFTLPLLKRWPPGAPAARPSP